MITVTSGPKCGSGRAGSEFIWAGPVLANPRPCSNFPLVLPLPSIVVGDQGVRAFVPLRKKIRNIFFGQTPCEIWKFC